MPDLPNHSDQQAPLAWLQSSNGEWRYFIDRNRGHQSNLSALEQDYIWLVSQVSSAHKINGYRIANDSIEMLVKQLAGVKRVVVFGLPDEQKGNAIHVYVERVNSAHDPVTLSKAINAKLAGCLGEFARADVIEYVEQLPMANNPAMARQILKSQKITMNCVA